MEGAWAGHAVARAFKWAVAELVGGEPPPMMPLNLLALHRRAIVTWQQGGRVPPMPIDAVVKEEGILRPDSARYHTPDKANVLYVFLGQEPKARVGFYYSLGQDERKLFGASHLKKHDQPTHLPPYEYQFFQSAGTLKSTDQMVERLVRRYPPPNVALSSLTTVATAASLHAAPCAHMRAHANSASEPNLVARVNSLFSLYVSLIFQINRGR